MANALGIDLANVLSSAETIRRQRAARMAEENALKDQETMRQARRRALQGDPTGTAEMLVMDPASVTQFQTAIKAMGQDQLIAERQSIEMMGQLAAAVLQDPDPPAAYKSLLAYLPPEIAGRMPQEFNPAFLRMSIARLAKAEDLFTATTEKDAEAVKHGNALNLEREKTRLDLEKQLAVIDAQLEKALKENDQATANQLRIDRARKQAELEQIAARGVEDRKTEAVRTSGDIRTERAKAEMKGTEPRVDTATSNAIRQAVATMFRTFYDPVTQEFATMDKDATTRANQIAAIAEELMMADPNLTVARAAQMARDQLQNATPAAPGPSAPLDPSDPLGIR